jgi:hypothetical protein
VAVEELGPLEAARIARISKMIEPSGVVVPSLFLHLARDETVLRFVESSLTEAVGDGRFQRSLDLINCRVDSAVASWPMRLDPIEDSETRALLMPFRETITRMLAAAGILRKASAPSR